ncbi:MFS transporter [Desertibacillus haloalkaliphilus]|uniref:MFS transporter n=1 Tax=Desertibacillus haloalkaliphilus TaxID=1328930 RepID=UPI001C25DFB5|nr:MFS transporter [Desertibacillus haloalkaliphilus]MBU8906416.1 MFS transporter [Desertibacillus haloalkaliphilus]
MEDESLLLHFLENHFHKGILILTSDEVCNLLLLYIIIAVAFIDTFSQLPIISPFSISLGASPLLVGVIIGMYSFSNIIGNVFSGIWTDRVGPKQVLCIGMFTVGTVVFLYSIVENPYQLLLVRFLHGIGGGLIVPAAFTLLGTQNERQTKGKTMSFSGASVGIAAITGPAMGAIITERLGFDWLFYIVAFVMIVFGFIAVFLTNGKRAEQKEKVTEPQNNNYPTKAVTSWVTSPLMGAYVSIFLLLFTLGILTYSLPLKIEDLHMNARTTGILLSVFGAVAIFFFLLPTNKVFDKYKKSSLMQMGLMIISIALVLLTISLTLPSLFIAMAVYGIGFALLFPSTSATVIEFSKERKRGKAFGLFYACFSLGVVTGSMFAGFFAFMSSYVFVLGALTLLLVVFLKSWLPKVLH